ncbi:RNA polymerase sigma factor CnrH [Pontiella desulfatans]|uniref:RNA polymerase sigma factor CnrH n=1 Tax=Pontiella desulfatans TaxID=2750659 RepID=A0A6C2U5V9_PONDE|nr:sigma-70 family RNA polymerase sigma factor [Pontiella desulfatans]VGO15462.1 RNA polymerase sigma factor CnrH [Pontiella desulfatans]
MDITEKYIREYSACEQDLRFYIASLINNKSDVDDILQETATAIWKKYELRDPEKPFLPWALTFAFNAVRNYRQKLKTRQKYFSNELLESMAVVEEKRHDELAAQSKILQSAIRSLSERERLLIEHRYSSGGTIQTLAEKLGEKPDALYKQLQRTREKLLRIIQLEMKRA